MTVQLTKSIGKHGEKLANNKKNNKKHKSLVAPLCLSVVVPLVLC